MQKQSGILMPIFSLPTKYGIGDFGKTSYNFIDFLYSAKQNVWQVLPLVQPGFGNSPYSSICSYSFNPYFISLDMLEEEKLLTKKDLNKAKFKVLFDMEKSLPYKLYSEEYQYLNEYEHLSLNKIEKKVPIIFIIAFILIILFSLLKIVFF